MYSYYVYHKAYTPIVVAVQLIFSWRLEWRKKLRYASKSRIKSFRDCLCKKGIFCICHMLHDAPLGRTTWNGQTDRRTFGLWIGTFIWSDFTIQGKLQNLVKLTRVRSVMKWNKFMMIQLQKTLHAIKSKNKHVKRIYFVFIQTSEALFNFIIDTVVKYKFHVSRST
jgi:hypothetical protein